MSTVHARLSTRGWSLESLVQTSPNFCKVDRVSASIEDIFSVLTDYELRGVPLVVENFHKHERWPSEMFTLENFLRNSESTDIKVRNVHNWVDDVIDLSDFISRSRSISQFADDSESERHYGKDAECPRAWEDWLQNSQVLPSAVLSCGPQDEFRFRPDSSRIETLMCYLGIGDTYTPCHKDLCASSGQNLMCYTEGNGSSFWFMTESSVAPEASAYFHKLGQELDHENHVITLNQLSKAPFSVHVVEQKVGDLVLVPPRSCHQVVNYGGITLKTSWSRMTLKGLSTAYYHELPIYRRVGRPETYRIKSTVHYAMMGRAKKLKNQLNLSNDQGPPTKSSFEAALVEAINSSTTNTKVLTVSSSKSRTSSSLALELKELIALYDSVLQEEYPGTCIQLSHRLSKTNLQTFSDDNRIVCDFCENDIFQSFFECVRCRDELSDGRIVCPGCYAEGRSCRCLVMQPMQCRDFQILLRARREAVEILSNYKGIQAKDIDLDLDLMQSNSNIPRLFRVACCILQVHKDTKRPTRICSIPNHGVHEVHYAWAFYCDRCHRSACFRYILNHLKIHSTEAILLHNSEATCINYHRKHLQSQTQFERSLDELKHSQKQGSLVDGHLLLAYIALEYSDFIPPNPKSLEFGWYDLTPEEMGFEPGSSKSTYTRLKGENTIKNSRLVITLPARNGLPSSSKGLQSTKRQIYVDIPSAPYRIPCKRRRTSSHRDDSSSLSSSSSHEQTIIQMTLPVSNENSNPSSTLVSPTSDCVKEIRTLPIKSSPLKTTEVDGNTTSETQHVEQVGPSTTSPSKFMEDQAAKKVVLSKLHFKKICFSPRPREDVSTMSPAESPISRAIGDLPDPLIYDTQKHPMNYRPFLEGAQYFPPPEEISNSGDISHLLTQFAAETHTLSQQSDTHPN